MINWLWSYSIFSYWTINGRFFSMWDVRTPKTLLTFLSWMFHIFHINKVWSDHKRNLLDMPFLPILFDFRLASILKCFTKWTTSHTKLHSWTGNSSTCSFYGISYLRNVWGPQDLPGGLTSFQCSHWDLAVLGVCTRYSN